MAKVFVNSYDALINAMQNGCVHLFYESGFSSEQMREFAGLVERSETLKKLTLWHCGLDEDTGRLLIEGLKRNINLAFLDISTNDLGDDTFDLLGKYLENNTTLTYLNLQHNLLSDRRLDPLSDALRRNRFLSKLDLSFNSFSLKSTLLLTEALAVNQGIRVLVMKMTITHLKGEGSKLLAKALERNNTLTDLWLTYNQIDSAGASAIASALDGNSNLTALRLGVNHIGDSGASALARALHRNETLTLVDLDDNEVSDRGARSIYKAVKQNNVMRDFSLSRNRVSKKYRRHIEDLLSQNRKIQEKLFFDALLGGGEKAQWRRVKLMVVGEGGAGKTATIRSLLGQTFDPEWNSTIAVDLQEATTTTTNAWEPSEGRDYATSLANRIAVRKLEEDVPRKKSSDSLLTSVDSQDTEFIDEPEREKDASYRDSRRSKSSLSTYRSSVRSVDSARRSIDSNRRSIDSNRRSVDNTNVQRRARGSLSRNQQVGGRRQRTTIVEKQLFDDEEPEILDERQKFNPRLFINAKSEDNSIKIIIWDYGGQSIFYTMHHLFLTKYGLYMLVFDLTKFSDHGLRAIQYIEFWLHSVKLHAPNSPVFLVGTCASKVDISLLNKTQKSLHKLIGTQFDSIVRNINLSFFAVDNKTGRGIGQLRAELEHIIRQQECINFEVSVIWMRCLDRLLEKPTSWIDYKDVIEMIRKMKYISIQEIDTMLELFHELGVIIHFTATEKLQSIVTTKPQWLVDAIGKVIRDKEIHKLDDSELESVGLQEDAHRLYDQGLVSRDLLEYLWNHEQVEFLIELMRSLLLLSTWNFMENEEVYLIPSMAVHVETPRYFCKDANSFIGLLQPLTFDPLAFVIEFEYMQRGVYERLLCLSIEYSASLKRVKEPLIRVQSSQIWLDDNSTLTIKKLESKIQITISKESQAASCLRIISSMLRKIKEDIMGDSFNWQIRVAHDGDYVNVEDIKEKKISRWFIHDTSRDPEDITPLQLENFMNSF